MYWGHPGWESVWVETGDYVCRRAQMSVSHCSDVYPRPLRLSECASHFEKAQHWPDSQYLPSISGCIPGRLVGLASTALPLLLELLSDLLLLFPWLISSSHLLPRHSLGPMPSAMGITRERSPSCFPSLLPEVLPFPVFLSCRTLRISESLTSKCRRIFW